MKITPYYVCYTQDGEKYIDYYEDKDQMLYTLARSYAFSDCCSDFNIDSIFIANHKIVYVGWQPGMLFEFRDVVTNKIIFSGRFPEWDH